MNTRRRKNYFFDESNTANSSNSGAATTARILEIVFPDNTGTNEDYNKRKADDLSDQNVDDTNMDDTNDGDDAWSQIRAMDDILTVRKVQFSTEPNWLTDFLNKESQDFEMLPADHNMPFEKHSKQTSSKRAFCIDMLNACTQNGMTFTQLNDVFEVLQRHTSNLNLPIIARNPLLPFRDDTPRVRNNIKKYTGNDNRTCEIDICPNDCVAFHGDEIFNGVKLSEMIFCPKCNEKRYSHCSNPLCRDKEYHECNPFAADPITKLPTGHQKRTPQKSLYYRPITAKLLQLYKLSLTDGNESLLRYFLDRYRVTREDCFIDINDGIEVKKQMSEMLEKFKEFCATYKTTSSDKVFQCSLLLTLFYDGITLFDRNAESVWPLLCSIASCNPSHRSKLGVGLFLTALHNVKPGSGAEKYFLTNILTEELKQLERGILFKFAHPETGEDVKVFLQARCIFTHLDTIALQHFARIQGSGSLNGCRICGLNGQSSCLGKIVYGGERSRLDIGHWLREFGQTRSRDLYKLIFEPAKDFYSSDKTLCLDEIKKEFEKATLGTLGAKQNIEIKPEHSLTKATIAKIRGYDEYSMEAKVPSKHNWYNNMFPLKYFLDSLFYALPDDRPQEAYEHLSNADYIKYGTEAEKLEAAYLAQYEGKDMPKTKKTHPYLGVHGVCPLVKELKGFTFERISYDLMHFCSNAGSYFLEFFKGARGLSDLNRRSSIAQRIFPFLKYKNVHPPWRLMDRDVIIIDSLVNALLIPSGFTGVHNMKFPARRTGHLRAKEHTIFMAAYAHYVYSFTRMKASYRHFVARFASDLNRLLNPCLPKKELQDLIESVYETRSIQEGLFPDSEKQFVFHEIVDIVNHVMKLGHVSGIMCYAGERSLSTIGRMRARGGINFLRGLFYNYIALENTHQYDTKVKETFLENSTNMPKYSDFVLKLLDKKSHVLVLNTYELNALFDCVADVLAVEIDEPVFAKSNFMRLRTVFFANKESNENMRPTMDFHSWAKELYTRYIRSKTQNSKADFSDLIVDFTMSTHAELIETDMLEEFTDHGALLVADFEGIVKDVATFQPRVFKKAVIKGLLFTGRGVNAREAQAPHHHRTVSATGKSTVHSYPTNNLNDISSNWWKSDDYSSWCMIRHYAKRSSNSTIATKTEMGQANYFFRLYLPSDTTLHGLAFADMAVRHTTYDRHRRHHFVSPNQNSFNGERQFVCLNYVCSTKLALSVLDKNNLPMVAQRKYGNARWASDSQIINLSPKGSPVARIYFLEMHPERVNYQYRDVEHDLDGTKTWEV